MKERSLDVKPAAPLAAELLKNKSIEKDAEREGRGLTASRVAGQQESRDDGKSELEVCAKKQGTRRIWSSVKKH